MDFFGKLFFILMIGAVLALIVAVEIDRQRDDEMFCGWLDDADEIEEELLDD